VPILSDEWEGLDRFYRPGEEILLCRTTQDVVDALAMSDTDLQRIAARARERTLAEHTADRRVIELEAILEGNHVGHHSRGGQGKSHPAAGVFERITAGGQSV
jgi:spore maturation protein CgeB